MKYYISLFALLIFFSCEEPIDLDNSQFYDVEDIVTAVNCTADCEETADCENENAKIIAIIDPSRIVKDSSSFYILDRTDSKIDMQVKVDTSATDIVFALITDKGGNTARIKGVLEGRDGTSSSNCQREIFVNLSNSGDLEIIE